LDTGIGKEEEVREKNRLKFGFSEFLDDYSLKRMVQKFKNPYF